MPASDHNSRGFVSRTAVSLASGTLALNLILIGGLVTLIAVNGLGFFWQKPVELLVLDDGTRYLGELQERKIQADGEGTRVRLKGGRGCHADISGVDSICGSSETSCETASAHHERRGSSCPPVTSERGRSPGKGPVSLETDSRSSQALRRHRNP